MNYTANIAFMAIILFTTTIAIKNLSAKEGHIYVKGDEKYSPFYQLQTWREIPSENVYGKFAQPQKGDQYKYFCRIRKNQNWVWAECEVTPSKRNQYYHRGTYTAKQLYYQGKTYEDDSFDDMRLQDVVYIDKGFAAINLKKGAEYQVIAYKYVCGQDLSCTEGSYAYTARTSTLVTNQRQYLVKFYFGPRYFDYFMVPQEMVYGYNPCQLSQGKINPNCPYLDEWLE